MEPCFICTIKLTALDLPENFIQNYSKNEVCKKIYAQGGEMNQALYAHMNNKRKMKKKKKKIYAVQNC
jgi:hypothetical protein